MKSLTSAKKKYNGYNTVYWQTYNIATRDLSRTSAHDPPVAENRGRYAGKYEDDRGVPYISHDLTFIEQT